MTRPKFGERYPVERIKMLGILVYARTNSPALLVLIETLNDIMRETNNVSSITSTSSANDPTVRISSSTAWTFVPDSPSTRTALRCTTNKRLSATRGATISINSNWTTTVSSINSLIIFSFNIN